MADSATIDFTAKQGSQGLAGGNPVVQYEQYVDASALNLAAASYAMFDVPEGHLHVSTMVEILTAEGGSKVILLEGFHRKDYLSEVSILLHKNCKKAEMQYS